MVEKTLLGGRQLSQDLKEARGGARRVPRGGHGQALRQDAARPLEGPGGAPCAQGSALAHVPNESGESSWPCFLFQVRAWEWARARLAAHPSPQAILPLMKFLEVKLCYMNTNLVQENFGRCVAASRSTAPSAPFHLPVFPGLSHFQGRMQPASA